MIAIKPQLRALLGTRRFLFLQTCKNYSFARRSVGGNWDSCTLVCRSNKLSNLLNCLQVAKEVKDGRYSYATEYVPTGLRYTYATSVLFSEHSIVVLALDGRTISVPLTWFPKLLNASPMQRENYRLIGRGLGIYWVDVNEDLSVDGLFAPFEHARMTVAQRQILKANLLARLAPGSLA